MKKKTLCKNCKYGAINFWGYTECWKFDQKIDWNTTNHTAHRELDANIENAHKDCHYFEKLTLCERLKREYWL